VVKIIMELLDVIWGDTLEQLSDTKIKSTINGVTSLKLEAFLALLATVLALRVWSRTPCDSCEHHRWQACGGNAGV
jgi:hypothetical protein